MNTNELLSIKDFSALTGIKPSKLRYYDEIGLFQPIHRGNNNYRYYTAQQTILVKLIQVLTSLGIPRKEIIQLAKHRTPETLLKVLTKQETLLNAQMRQIVESCSVIHTFRTFIERGLDIDENAIHIQASTQHQIHLGPRNDFEGHDEFYNPFIDYCHYAEKRGINLCNPIGGYFESLTAFESAPAKPTCFFSVTPTGSDCLAAGNYLVGYTRGYYGEMGDVADRIFAHAKKENIKLVGPVYAVYLHDEISIANPDQYLMQVSIPIQTKQKRSKR